VLDEGLVADFRAARMRGVPRCSPEEKSRKISANTELRQARCVFSAEALLSYRRAGLCVPDLSSFLAAPRFMRVCGQPQLPADHTVRAVFGGLPEIMVEDPEVFTVVALALFAGLRRNELRHLGGNWFQTTAGPSVVVRQYEGFRAKNYSERTIPLPGWVFELLVGRTGERYVAEPDMSVRERTLDRAVRWLRRHGLHAARKPLHVLRAFYAAYLLAVEPSAFYVKSRLGHADLTTTFRYYAAEPLSRELAALWTQTIGFAPGTAAGA